MRYRNEDVLRELYFKKGLSTHEMADELDCSQSTIRNWMDKHGIERHDRMDALHASILENPASYRTGVDGYEVWQSRYDGKCQILHVHRLLAVAKYGAERVAGVDVHHKNEIPWDNRPENIELVDHADHAAKHAESMDRAATGEYVQKNRLMKSGGEP